MRKLLPGKLLLPNFYRYSGNYDGGASYCVISYKHVVIRVEVSTFTSRSVSSGRVQEMIISPKPSTRGKEWRRSVIKLYSFYCVIVVKVFQLTYKFF